MKPLPNRNPAWGRRGSATTALARIFPALVVSLLLQSCAASYQVIENVEPVGQGGGYQAQYRKVDERETAPPAPASSTDMNAARCTSSDGAISPDLRGGVLPPDIEILSVGDLVDVSLPDDETLGGKYRVSQDGTIKIVHMPAVRALGRSVSAVQDEIDAALVSSGTYGARPGVSVRLMEYGSARVFVGGAVFDPGAYTIGGPPAATSQTERLSVIGAATDSRRLSRALQFAGGVRPDADLSKVSVTRGKRRTVYDLRPAVLGRAFPDVLLLAGDQIDVPSRGCFQEALMTPSPVSPPGVTVFLSNLTVPASSNSQSSNGKEAREMRWGTRFLQAAVGMNCVGGTALTSADRTVVLISRNPITGASTIIARRPEELLKRADRDTFDPWIMPGDALACYDSSATNLSDVLRIVDGVATTVTGF